MKLLVFVAFLGLASSVPVDHVVAVTEDTLGFYDFAFNAGDHERKEVRQHDGETKGHFTFVAPEGIHHKIEYSAGAEKGFIAKGAHLPVPSVNSEVIKATNEHLATWHATAEANGVFEEKPHSFHSGLQGQHSFQPNVDFHKTPSKTVKVLVPVVQYVKP